MDSEAPPLCEDPRLAQAFAELDEELERLRCASKASLHTSEQFTRVVRAAKPSKSDPAMRAVRPPAAAADEADLTREFAALRRAL